MVERTGFDPEELRETYVEIKKLNDPLINLFLEVLDALPDLDHVSANKRLKH